MLVKSAAGTSSPGRVRLPGLTATAFQHPLDRQASGALQSLKGFDWLVKKFIEFGVERAAYAENIGSNIRVGPRQMSKLYAMMTEGCDILDVPEPELYVSLGGVNAYTSGHTKPYIVVQTGLLDTMNDEEVMAVIAHELGHIKCGHVLYYTMARFIGPIFEVFGDIAFGIGRLVGKGIESALLTWQRRSEFSADRAALLVMQDSRPCVSMLMKIAGGSHRWAEHLDTAQFLNQARAYQEGMDKSMLDRVYRFLAHSGNTHPVAVQRARILDEWTRDTQYEEILAGRYVTNAKPPEGESCPTCQNTNEPGSKFCVKCGTPLRAR